MSRKKSIFLISGKNSLFLRIKQVLKIPEIDLDLSHRAPGRCCRALFCPWLLLLWRLTFLWNCPAEKLKILWILCSPRKLGIFLGCALHWLWWLYYIWNSDVLLFPFNPWSVEVDPGKTWRNPQLCFLSRKMEKTGRGKQILTFFYHCPLPERDGVASLMSPDRVWLDPIGAAAQKGVGGEKWDRLAEVEQMGLR